MPQKRNTSSHEKPNKPSTIVFHHHKFVWNWRMLILGILLNIATLSLVVYTVSLLNDYRQCTQGYLNTQIRQTPTETREQPTDDGSNSVLNLNINSTE